MIVTVKVDGLRTVILGYAPGAKGEPVAIVPALTPDGTIILKHAKLSEIEVEGLPKKLVKRLQRQREEP